MKRHIESSSGWAFTVLDRIADTVSIPPKWNPSSSLWRGADEEVRPRAAVTAGQATVADLRNPASIQYH
jgi:hypothetical protein